MDPHDVSPKATHITLNIARLKRYDIHQRQMGIDTHLHTFSLQLNLWNLI